MTTPTLQHAADTNTGAALYRHARQVIPGGTQLLSKRPEMFLPEQWPAYYRRAKGCRVEDLDGKSYLDMTTCGIGSCLLGFADDAVNAAVKQAVDMGTMCTLNPPQEVELADILLQIHPWAQMVRYARTGGESLAVAVRIARAATKRDTVAICGYHGWHDWYLAANLAEDRALDGHLLPGLAPVGVPRSLIGSAVPIPYGQIEPFRSVVEKHADRLAAVVMEPMRYEMPPDGYLEEIRRWTQSRGIVLIFDEVTSGWRHHFGGMHLKLGVQPDMAVYAKSISNGYPMGAVVGSRGVMQAAQDTFISSTYWTEAIGPTAALATIAQMRHRDLPTLLSNIGMRVREGWMQAGQRHGLPVYARGMPALLHLGFHTGKNELDISLQTLFTQEMLGRGILAGQGFYPTAAHDIDAIDQYLLALDETFTSLKTALDSNDVTNRLLGPVVHQGFKRLT